MLMIYCKNVLNTNYIRRISVYSYCGGHQTRKLLQTEEVHQTLIFEEIK